MAIIKWISYKKRPWCLSAAAYQGQSVGRHPPQIRVIQGNIICREFKNNDKMDKKSVCFLSLPWTSLLNNVGDKILLPAGIPSLTAVPLPACMCASLHSGPSMRMQTYPNDSGKVKTILRTSLQELCSVVFSMSVSIGRILLEIENNWEPDCSLLPRHLASRGYEDPWPSRVWRLLDEEHSHPKSPVPDPVASPAFREPITYKCKPIFT